ncbi:MAG: acyloxyacyl hydrolase [Chlamydiales bacterium]|nr:acyloxyacyl hydrolase [Chlamydiales bacterium]
MNSGIVSYIIHEMKNCVLFLALAFASCFAADNPPLLMGGVGLFDIGGKTQGSAQLEYRGGHAFYHIHTMAGVTFTTNEAFLGYLGLAYDIGLGEKYKLTPSAAVGGYSRGNGQNLGSFIQFRPAIELTRVYSNRIRLGLQYSYLTNFGTAHPNPGVNNLVFLFGVPLNFIL